MWRSCGQGVKRERADTEAAGQDAGMSSREDPIVAKVVFKRESMIDDGDDDGPACISKVEPYQS